MLCLYRLSDQAQTMAYKPKLPEATKLVCLKNFLEHFDANNVIVIADNVSKELLDAVRSLGVQYILESDFGNGGHSFLFAAQIVATSELPDNAIVYFVEDDYLHTENSQQLLVEALQLPSVSYATLYDHPDKYMPEHMIPSRIYVSPSRHWRTIPSTTMTFATTVGVVRNDLQYYQAFCKSGYPHDHELFLALARDMKRTLVSCMPGASTHVEKRWLSPFMDWVQIAQRSAAK